MIDSASASASASPEERRYWSVKAIQKAQGSNARRESDIKYQITKRQGMAARRHGSGEMEGGQGTCKEGGKQQAAASDVQEKRSQRDAPAQRLTTTPARGA
ncbi:hypothetical protein MKX08_003695 [Trichoderma sp. CBMAI-0020]|nr:hypothetical protein MKX08_003695 [Trichoderma sp. CBMAI-0020]